MDMKIFLMATIVVCLKMPESHGSLYHTRRHQCIPPLARLYEPIVYNVAGAGICAFKCSRYSCLFFEFTDPDVCKIYGLGMESTNVYVNTDFAAPPAGGPLQEMAKGKPAHTSGGWAIPVFRYEKLNGVVIYAIRPLILESLNFQSSNAVDDDLVTRWEGGGLHPWWMVDLGAYYFIHYVDTLPKKGYFAYRFQEVEVRAGVDLPGDRDLSQWEFLGLYPGVYDGSEDRVHFNTSQGVCGRFLSVQQMSQLNDAFALYDVEVYVRERYPY